MWGWQSALSPEALRAARALIRVPLPIACIVFHPDFVALLRAVTHIERCKFELLEKDPLMQHLRQILFVLLPGIMLTSLILVRPLPGRSARMIIGAGTAREEMAERRRFLIAGDHRLMRLVQARRARL
jgi:hypothetical protein